MTDVRPTGLENYPPGGLLTWPAKDGVGARTQINFGLTATQVTALPQTAPEVGPTGSLTDRISVASKLSVAVRDTSHHTKVVLQAPLQNQHTSRSLSIYGLPQQYRLRFPSASNILSLLRARMSTKPQSLNLGRPPTSAGRGRTRALAPKFGVRQVWASRLLGHISIQHTRGCVIPFSPLPQTRLGLKKHSPNSKLNIRFPVGTATDPAGVTLMVTIS